MVGCLIHRGPDDSGQFVGDGIALGHTRLAVIDRSEAGRQPMKTPDGRWILIYNGEAYGFDTLRRELEARRHRFRSRTDTEVVLRAWHEWGPDALARLDGMYAFAVWDRERKTLHLVRDRMGIKPLYWCWADGVLLFASEIRALLASGRVPRRLDRAVLRGFLSQQTAPTPSTLVKGVQMLRPASRMEVRLEGERAGEPFIYRYWDALAAAHDRREALAGDSLTAARGLRERLSNAIRRHLVADVPLGAFLSGGIDSSVVVGLMTQEARQVLTFTVAWDDPGYDDGFYARLVAKRFKTKHAEVFLPDGELVEQIPRAVSDQDHPSGDGVNTWLVSRAARQAGLTVVLSGLGADELFGGYASFRRIQRLRRLQPFLRSLPEAAQRGVGTLLRAFSASVAIDKTARLLRTNALVPAAYPIFRQVFAPEQVAALLNGQADGQQVEVPFAEELRAAFEAHPSQPLLAQLSYAELTCYMRDVLLRDTDQMSMAHSLEVRVPFLDKEVVEYALALPDEARDPSTQLKRYLVGALDGLLPRDVVRRSKSGFVMPFDRWMRGPLRSFCEEGIGVVADHGAFSSDAAWGVWHGFLSRHPSLPWTRPWLLVALGRWLEREGVA